MAIGAFSVSSKSVASTSIFDGTLKANVLSNASIIANITTEIRLSASLLSYSSFNSQLLIGDLFKANATAIATISASLSTSITIRCALKSSSKINAFLTDKPLLIGNKKEGYILSNEVKKLFSNITYPALFYIKNLTSTGVSFPEITGLYIQSRLSASIELSSIDYYKIQITLIKEGLYYKDTSLDMTSPLIKLNGNTQYTVIKGGQYIELGAYAIDDRDGTLPVLITGRVNNKKIGNYPLTYTATDKSGNTSSVNRMVQVIYFRGEMAVKIFLRLRQQIRKTIILL